MDVIDDVLTVCNENAAIYGRKAYIQGLGWSRCFLLMK